MWKQQYVVLNKCCHWDSCLNISSMQGGPGVILSKTRWAIPLCGGNPQHWMFGWANFTTQQLGIYDSHSSTTTRSWAEPLSITAEFYVQDKRRNYDGYLHAHVCMADIVYHFGLTKLVGPCLKRELTSDAERQWRHLNTDQCEVCVACRETSNEGGVSYCQGHCINYRTLPIHIHSIEA